MYAYCYIYVSMSRFSLWLTISIFKYKTSNNAILSKGIVRFHNVWSIFVLTLNWTIVCTPGLLCFHWQEYPAYLSTRSQPERRKMWNRTLVNISQVFSVLFSCVICTTYILIQIESSNRNKYWIRRFASFNIIKHACVFSENNLFNMLTFTSNPINFHNG